MAGCLTPNRTLIKIIFTFVPLAKLAIKARDLAARTSHWLNPGELSLPLRLVPSSVFAFRLVSYFLPLRH